MKPPGTRSEHDLPAPSGRLRLSAPVTDRINAVVIVESSGGSKQMRLLELLRTCVADTELFERLSEMNVGQTVEIRDGQRVQRIK